MEGILIPVLRTVASFVLLIVITAAIGKHINAHKNHYNFALNITIGSFIANMGFNTNLNYMNMLMAFISMVILFYLFLVLSSKSRLIRGWLSGNPTVLIEDGRILENNMKKVRFSLDDLNQQLREGGVFYLFEVEFALLEASGELSILKKKPYQVPTFQDLDLTATSGTLPIELIMNGKIIRENVTEKYNSDWLTTECNKRNLRVEDVFYAVVNSKGELFIDKFNDLNSSPSDSE